MTILFAGGERESFSRLPPDDSTTTSIANSGGQTSADAFDDKFCRCAISGNAGFIKLDTSVADFWLHFDWYTVPSFSGSYGLVFEKSGVAVGRFNFDSGRFVYQSSPDGVAFVTRTAGIDLFTLIRTRATFDLHVAISSGSLVVQVYKNGALVDSYSGSATSSALNIDTVNFAFDAGVFSEIIIATVNTIGMRVFTLEPTDSGPRGQIYKEWTGVDEYGQTTAFAASIVGNLSLSPTAFIGAEAPGQTVSFDRPILTSGYRPNVLNGIDYDLIAIAGNAVLCNIPGSAIVDSRFILTDGTTTLVSSPRGAAPDGIFRSLHYVWEGRSFTDAANLQFGVVAQ